MFENVEIKRKVFVGIEQGTGKNKHNVLAVMSRDMMAQGKDQIINNCGTACLFVDEKACESSVMLHKQKTPEKVKDA